MLKKNEAETNKWPSGVKAGYAWYFCREFADSIAAGGKLCTPGPLKAATASVFELIIVSKESFQRNF